MTPETPEDDGIPLIQIGAQLPELIAAATEALGRDENLYVRTGKLVTIAREPERLTPYRGDGRAGGAALRLRPGTPRIVELAPATLIERLATVARWERFNARDREWYPCFPDKTVAATIFAKPERDGLRPLDSVFEAPFLRHDGCVVQTPGYDRVSACTLLPGREDYPRIAEAPTLDEARASLLALRAVLEQMPFRRGADQDVPIAALLTMLARPAILGACPAFLFDASTRGSGKSLVANVVSAIASGRPAPLMTWADREEETEKVLGSCALSGVRIILFDNVTHPIAGGPLDKVLTAPDEVSLRILGKSETPSVPWRAIVLFTGNNLDVRGDTERRSLLCRLEPAEECPEDRQGFTHPRLLDWVLLERPRLLAAALTLLRAHQAAGCPGMNLQWGSFEAWTEVVAAAIVWAGGSNVLETRPSVRGSHDPESVALLSILEHWRKLQESPLAPPGAAEGLSTRAAIQILYPDRMQHGPPDPKLDVLREAFEALAPHKSGRGVDANWLSRRFRRLADRWRNDRRLTAATAADHGGSIRWTVQVRETTDPADLYHCNNEEPANDKEAEAPPTSGTRRG